MKEVVKESVHSSKGFFIGDICYVLPRSIYFGIWRDKYHFSEGLIKVNTDGSEDMTFAVAHTHFGDGLYLDDKGNEYPVDACEIGIVPLELVVECDGYPGFNPGLYVNTPGTAMFEVEDGVFDITLPDGQKIHIDTTEMYVDGSDE